jgi:leucyl-tRNA synthetase
MVCKTAHYCPACKWLSEDQVADGRCAACGKAVQSDVAKMSKTKLNTVNPDAIFEKYGADTLRLYIISDSPPDRDQLWSDEALAGSYRFLNRIWDLADRHADALKAVPPYAGDGTDLSPPARDLWRKAHATIRKVTEHIEDGLRLNTAVSAVMELATAVRGAAEEVDGGAAGVVRQALESLVLLVAPATPHIAEELWRRFGHAESVMEAAWPSCDERALAVDTVEMPVQVNGKVRGRIAVPADAAEEAVREAALADGKVAAHVGGKPPRKVIVIPGRMVNIVV